MRKYNDQVFPTSLSEIAFTLVFLLMLLLGYMFLKEQKEKTELQTKLANTNQTQSAGAAREALEEARIRFESEMAAADHPLPQQITAKLVEASDVQVARDRLGEETRDLNERMSATTLLWEKIERAGGGQSEKVAREEIEQALKLQEEIRKLTIGQTRTSGPLGTKQALENVKNALDTTSMLREEAKSKLGMEIRSGQESSALRDLIESARKSALIATDTKTPGALKAENEKLRGQIQYFTNRGKLRGLDHPPCWADADGKIEYLFNVETRPDGFITTKAWPGSREQDARLLPNIDSALIAGTTNPATFAAAMQPILNWSKAQDPECRHFVYLSTTVSDADARDNARKIVEGFFYKLEIKR